MANVESFRPLALLGLEVHSEELLCFLLQLGKVSFHRSDELTDGVISDIVARVEQPLITLNELRVVIDEQRTKDFLVGFDVDVLSEISDALVVGEADSAEKLTQTLMVFLVSDVELDLGRLH